MLPGRLPAIWPAGATRGAKYNKPPPFPSSARSTTQPTADVPILSLRPIRPIQPTARATAEYRRGAIVPGSQSRRGSGWLPPIARSQWRSHRAPARIGRHRAGLVRHPGEWWRPSGPPGTPTLRWQPGCPVASAGSTLFAARASRLRITGLCRLASCRHRAAPSGPSAASPPPRSTPGLGGREKLSSLRSNSR